MDQNTINISEVAEQFDLVSIVERYNGPMKRVGGGYTCACPFKESHTGRNKTNFSVQRYQGRWVYKCFSCDRTGDVVTFVREMESLANNYEAARFLLGESDSIQRVQRPEPPKKVNPPLPANKAIEYHKNLNTYPHAVDWWKAQGLKKATMRIFQVGYCPNHRIWIPGATKDDPGIWESHETYTIPVYIEGELKTIRHRLAHPHGKSKYRPERSGDGAWLYNQDIRNHPQVTRDMIAVLAGEKKVQVCHQEVNLTGMVSEKEFTPFISATAGATNWFGDYGRQWAQTIADFRYKFICFDPNELEQAERTALLFGRYGLIVSLDQNPDDLLVQDKEHGLDRLMNAFAQAQPVRARSYWT